MNRESSALDITAGKKLDSLQNGSEACNAMEQHPFRLTSRTAFEAFSSCLPFPFLINLIRMNTG
jgi:hypothetical protein